MIAVLTGLAAGGLHVFSGPDHLAALAPVALERPSQAAKTGSYWGLGHGIGVVAIGGLGLWLRSFIDVEAWSAWAEFSVGILLIGVGFWAVVRARRLEIHAHEHDHSEETHAHLHAHGDTPDGHRHAAMGIGILHGVAGTGNLFGVVPALALPVQEAALYLVAYLASGVAAMSGFAWVLGVAARRGGPRSIRWLMLGSGVVAAAVGAVWLVRSWPI
ncbi:MAG: hydantoin utilization protein A [Acidimicrobiia bacterium]|nr:hydantoin utilization protein A [Acidimicrobiia bacterium]